MRLPFNNGQDSGSHALAHSICIECVVNVVFICNEIWSNMGDESRRTCYIHLSDFHSYIILSLLIPIDSICFFFRSRDDITFTMKLYLFLLSILHVRIWYCAAFYIYICHICKKIYNLRIVYMCLWLRLKEHNVYFFPFSRQYASTLFISPIITCTVVHLLLSYH